MRHALDEHSWRGRAMNRVIFRLTLILILVPVAAGQSNVSARPATPAGTYNVPFCPPTTCLYYAGDYDSANSNALALFNADYTNGSVEGQAWVGVKPNRDVTVTGATFVEFLTSGYIGTNPTPFAVQTGIQPGQAGKTICNTSGNATISLYQDDTDYSYTVKKLSRPCKLLKSKVYYVNLLPTSSNGYGAVANVEDARPKNHYGWKNDLNDCYFNSAYYGQDYVTCNSQGPFSELSIALTGKK
jgi:hypothetical protein